MRTAHIYWASPMGQALRVQRWIKCDHCFQGAQIHNSIICIIQRGSHCISLVAGLCGSGLSTLIKQTPLGQDRPWLSLLLLITQSWKCSGALVWSMQRVLSTCSVPAEPVDTQLSPRGLESSNIDSNNQQLTFLTIYLYLCLSRLSSVQQPHTQWGVIHIRDSTDLCIWHGNFLAASSSVSCSNQIST